MRQARRLLGLLVAVVPMAMVIVTVIDVIGRRFDAPLPGAIEIIELLMGLLVFGALPLITADREHVTVGLFDGFMSDRFRAVRDRLVAGLSAIVVGVIAWRLLAKANELASFADTSLYLGVPLAPLGYFMTAMAAATVAVLLAHALLPGKSNA